MRWLGIAFPYLLFGTIIALAVASSVPAGGASEGSGGRHLCPPCRMEVNPAWSLSSIAGGRTYYFCSRRCKERFDADPARFLAPRCLVCGRRLKSGPRFPATYLGKRYELCSEAHRAEFKSDPAAYFMHRMWGIPSPLYYGSIGIVLLVSFGIFDRRGRKAPLPVRGGTPAPAAPARARWDLLQIRWLRRALRSRFFRFSFQAIVVALFLLIIAAGLWGNQNPALNIAPILTWTIWWGLLPLMILFAGKIWCYVCPWDAIAGWTERLSLWRRKPEGLSYGLRWPRVVRNISIAALLFIGLTWVELGFGVTMKPRVTAYLAVAMLILALVSALLFDRKSFCRYGCLVGRVSGLYAMFAGTEVRVRDRDVCRNCRGKECVTGTETAYGCPTFLYPGRLETNTYCIQCMECLQACPKDNIALNLRPLGSDLAVEGKPRTDEAYLALLMLSITAFHGLTMTPVWAELVEALRAGTGAGRVAAFSLGMAAVMAAPIVLYALLAGISRWLGRRHAVRPLSYRDYFVRYAYALLPIALFYHIAHNLQHLLMEGPKIIALASDPFGWNWNLFGTAGWNVPPLISLEKLWLVQVALVLIGHIYSLWVAQKTALRLFGSARAAFRSQIPMLIAMILFSMFSLWLLKQPMEMRTSAM